MKAKIHFLAIPAQEFSKILTAPRHQFLCDLLSFHQWQHRQEYKFITPFENPKEIQDILTREEIPFFSGVQFFEL